MADAAPESGDRNGSSSTYEQALADYLQERIKPGLNSGAIPLLTRSIARDLAHGGGEEKLADYLQERITPGLNPGAIPLLARSIAHDLLSGDVDPQVVVDDGDRGREERGDDEEDEAFDFEAEMRDLQSELGDDWIVRFSVYRDDDWLTADKVDGSQHVEAPDASALIKAVKLLDGGGGGFSG